MAGFGGIIAGALGGAAKSVGEIAGDQIKNQQRLDLEKMLMQAREEMELRVDEIKRGRDTRDIGRNAEAKAAAAPVLAKGEAAATAARTRAELDAGVPEMKAEGDTRAYKAGGEKRDLEREDKNKSIRAEGVAKLDVKNMEDADYVSNPAAREAERARAKDRHVESAASSAQAELTRLTIDERREVQRLQREYDAAPPEKKDAIRERIQMLTGKDPDSFEFKPLVDELGRVTDYQAYDKKSGRKVTTGAPTGPQGPWSKYGKSVSGTIR